jgi:hypothetical protein
MAMLARGNRPAITLYQASPPAMSALHRPPVAAVAEREPVRHEAAELRQMRGDGLRLRGRTLHGDDARQAAQSADERRAEAEMRGAGVVVDAERQAARSRHRGEVLKHLLLAQRRVGHGRQEAGGRSGGLRVLGEPHGVIGAQRADPDEDGDLRASLLDRGIERAATLEARKIGIGAGAAEEADGVDLSGTQRGDEPAKGVNLDPTLGVRRRDRESGKPLQKHRHLVLRIAG